MFERRAILVCGALALPSSLACESARLQGCGGSAVQPSTHRSVRVAAASDLTAAFEVLARDFTRETGAPVQFTFGSTGLLARQLRERAPFDVFAAANAEFVHEVVAAGSCDDRTRAPYGLGRVVVWTRKDAGAAASSIEDLLEPRFERIAIAHPEHAPYGKAAREALTASGLWRRLEPRIVYAENVRQALQLADSGNVEVALVALSLVIERERGRYLEVDRRLHAPIEQTLVACRHGTNEAGGREFARFVNGARGRAVMKHYGFLLPGETLVHAP